MGTMKNNYEGAHSSFPDIFINSRKHISIRVVFYYSFSHGKKSLEDWLLWLFLNTYLVKYA